MTWKSSTADTTEADEGTANTADETATSAEDEPQITSEVLPETVTLGVPASASQGEAAAIAAAVGAHLRDRAAAETATDAPEHCNRWKLCGRLGGRTPPREVVRGEEWKAAARARR